MGHMHKFNVNSTIERAEAAADSLRTRVDWCPLKKGGASFRTQWLAKPAFNRYCIKPTLGARLFTLAFLVPGMLVLAILVPFQFFKGNLHDGFFLLIFGAVFAGVGAFMYHAFSRGLAFDRAEGRYYVAHNGKDKPVRTFKKNQDQEGRLEDIRALQVLTETIDSHSLKGRFRTSSGRYQSHEINLILENGKRINVMDHGQERAIEDCARELASFLDVPVWRTANDA